MSRQESFIEEQIIIGTGFASWLDDMLFMRASVSKR